MPTYRVPVVMPSFCFYAASIEVEAASPEAAAALVERYRDGAIQELIDAQGPSIERLDDEVYGEWALNDDQDIEEVRT